MKKLLSLAAGCCILLACNNQPAEQSTKTDSTATAAAETKPGSPKDVEFADAKYMDIGKAALAAMSKGDISGWLANYADNAVYIWSAGDSLAGLPAITKYWTDRRSNVIDSIAFSNDIWLAIKVNKPQRGPDMEGVWLLGWYQFNSKYKNGKRVGGWIHHDMHFNDAGKIDRSVQYIDRAPINAALAKK
jgi:ketosteroid isomerase-like protein